MKLQELTESMRSGLNDQSILRSDLAKKEKVVEELRKEIEVNICNYCTVCVSWHDYILCEYIPYYYFVGNEGQN